MLVYHRVIVLLTFLWWRHNLSGGWCISIPFLDDVWLIEQPLAVAYPELHAMVQ